MNKHVAPEDMEGGFGRGVTYFSGKLSLQDVRATVNGCVYHHVSRCIRHEGTEEMEGDIHSDRH